MVRKVSAIVCSLVLICALCTTAQASTHTHTVYENSSISSTYITYFKDIVTGIPHNYLYIGFRSGQNSYTLITAKYHSNEGTKIWSSIDVTEHVFYTDSENYNQNYKYRVNKLDYFEIDISDKIVYTNFGEYPQLHDERSYVVEHTQTVIMLVALFAVYISRIFNSSKRRNY